MLSNVMDQKNDWFCIKLVDDLGRKLKNGKYTLIHRRYDIK